MNQEKLNSKLLEVAKKGDTGRVRELVEQGADINARGKWGWTALMWAALKGHLTPELLGDFVSHGADINARDEYGNTALMESAVSGTLTHELLDVFLNHRADICALNNIDNSAMAMCFGNLFFHRNMRSLMAFFVCGRSVRDIYPGWTPENFSQWLKSDKDLNNGQRTAYALLVAMSLYPVRSEILEGNVSGKRSIAARLLLPHLKDAPLAMRNAFIRILSEGRAGALFLSGENILTLVCILLETFDSDPDGTIVFVRKRIGKNFEKWAGIGIPRMDELVAKMSSRLSGTLRDSEGELPAVF